MLVGGAACIGESHKRNGLPLQDSFEVFGDSAQKYAVAVVSDGAGSARHAEVGSKRICSILAKEFRRLCEAGPTVSFPAFKETVSFAIQSTRRSLVDDGYSLADCHATVVATLAFDDKCFLVHLGDGIHVVFIREPNGTIAACVSEPENGDASNETFFYTEDDWHNHLRLTEIPREVLACLLMSDGMEEFVWNPKAGLKLPFCRPLLQKSRDAVISGQDLNATLSDVVSDERTNKFTNDDKTLCLVLRKGSTLIIDDAGGNLNQYVIRNGQPVKFFPSPENSAILNEKKTPLGVSANSESRKPILKSSPGMGPESSTRTNAATSKAIKTYKRNSSLFSFFLGLGFFLIGLVSGYFLNDLEQNVSWTVKIGPTQTGTSIPTKGTDNAEPGSKVADEGSKQEIGGTNATSPPAIAAEPTKDAPLAEPTKADGAPSGPAPLEAKGDTSKKPSKASDTSSKSSPGQPTKAVDSKLPSVETGNKTTDTAPRPIKGSDPSPGGPSNGQVGTTSK